MALFIKRDESLFRVCVETTSTIYGTSSKSQICEMEPLLAIHYGCPNVEEAAIAERVGGPWCATRTVNEAHAKRKCASG
jgi:hypothetical protein